MENKNNREIMKVLNFESIGMVDYWYCCDGTKLYFEVYDKLKDESFNPFEVTNLEKKEKFVRTIKEWVEVSKSELPKDFFIEMMDLVYETLEECF
jgi:hypothetical protein